MPKQKRRAKHGFCKLTLRPGKFVKSHIIPQAFTKPEVSGMPLFQLGHGRTPVRRWSSWYDPQLVSEDGEKILSDIDTWAIAELRRQKLVWSGWGDQADLGCEHSFVRPEIGIRKIEGIEPERMRQFFLSLLWRAAATSLPEFAEVVLPTEHLEALRAVVVGGGSLPQNLYPVQLTQLSTKGIIHNHAAVRDAKLVENLQDPKAPPIEFPTFRFYFDGLIAHFHLPVPALEAHVDSPLFVGNQRFFVVSTVTYANSIQRLEVESAIRGQLPRA